MALNKGCEMRKTVVIAAIALAGLSVLIWLSMVWLSMGGTALTKLDMQLAHDKDVTAEREYWGGYEFGQNYELLMDVFIERVKDWSDRLILTPPGQLPQGAGLYSAPDTVAEYREKPQDWPQVVGVLSVGTQLKCKMLRKHGTPMWGDSITVFAEILDGPQKGRLVDIDDVSTMIKTEYRGCILTKPDPRILRTVIGEKGN
jgi:hypothetical protein